MTPRPQEESEVEKDRNLSAALVLKTLLMNLPTDLRYGDIKTMATIPSSFGLTDVEFSIPAMSKMIGIEDMYLELGLKIVTADGGIPRAQAKVSVINDIGQMIISKFLHFSNYNQALKQNQH